nr:calcium binding protein [uncultured bacterium]
MDPKSRLWAGTTIFKTNSAFRPRQMHRFQIVSPLRRGETVEVRRLASEDICAADMLVLVLKHGRNLAVPLSQLTAINTDEPTTEAISDWHYWLAQGYSF